MRNGSVSCPISRELQRFYLFNTLTQTVGFIRGNGSRWNVVALRRFGTKTLCFRKLISRFCIFYVFLFVNSKEFRCLFSILKSSPIYTKRKLIPWNEISKLRIVPMSFGVQLYCQLSDKTFIITTFIHFCIGDARTNWTYLRLIKLLEKQPVFQ